MDTFRCDTDEYYFPDIFSSIIITLVIYKSNQLEPFETLPIHTPILVLKAFHSKAEILLGLLR